MTLVNLSVKETILGGFASASASCEAVYWAGNGPYHEVVGADVRYSTSIKVMFSGESISLELEPTRGICCVRWTIRNQRTGDTLTRFTTIPDDTEINFGDLVRVNPESFEPSDFGVSGWESAIVEATTAVSEAVMARDESREAAQTSSQIKTTVENSVNIAAGYASSAATSASHASSYKTDAESALSRTLSTADSIPTLVGNEITTQVNPLVSHAESSSRNSAESAAQAESHRILAQNSEESVHNDALAAAQARLETSGFATSANQSSISAEAARLASVEARTGAETARIEAEAARDLALAGQFKGAQAPSGTDFDTLAIPGVVRFGSDISINTALNRPMKAVGVLEVMTSTGIDSGAVFQRYSPYATSTRLIGTYVRARSANGVWSPWRFIPTQRVDTTAGLAVYTWDDVNNREQMIYGDTGWRDLLSGVYPEWVGAPAVPRLRIKRQGSTVIVQVRLITTSLVLAGRRPIVDLPNGFISTNYGTVGVGARSNNTPVIFNTQGLLNRFDVASDKDWPVGTLLDGEARFTTDHPWPTTLPGTPA